MKIHDCDQYDPTWFKLRRGVPTSSDSHRIVTPAKWELASGRSTYIADLIADKFNPWYGMVDDRVSTAMAEGSAMEPTARRYYEFDRNCTVKQVGFITTDDGRFGYSPDGLVGDDGLIELKSPQHHTHVKWLLAGVVPAEHLAQCHSGLIVTERKWIDFMSYAEGLPPLLVRVTPDERTEKLRGYLDKFWDEYQTALTQVETMFKPLPTREIETSVGTITEEIYEPSYW